VQPFTYVFLCLVPFSFLWNQIFDSFQNESKMGMKLRVPWEFLHFNTIAALMSNENFPYRADSSTTVVSDSITAGKFRGKSPAPRPRAVVSLS
jgi:hypothetical protein